MKIPKNVAQDETSPKTLGSAKKEWTGETYF